jgi:YidC/Oxa1 family membrane protein insertase
MSLFSSPDRPPSAHGKKDEMHPDDIRNMFIFFVLAALVYFSYDAFVLEPQREAIKVQNEINKDIKLAVESGNEEAGEAPDKPRAQILSEQQRLKFATNELRGSIDLTAGGRLDDLSLNRYFQTLEDKKNVNVLNPKGTELPRGVEYGWLASGGGVRVPGKDARWQVANGQTLRVGGSVTLVWDNGQGLRFERDIAVDEHFMFTITQRVINNTESAVTIYPYGLVSQKGIPSDYAATWISHEGPVGFIEDKLYNEDYNDLRDARKETFQGSKGWFGITDKYWLTALIPPQDQSVKYSFNYAGSADDKDNDGLYQADYLGEAVTVSAGASASVKSHLFVGAKEVLLLRDYEDNMNIPQFDLAVDFGWFWFMTKPFFYALHYLNLWIGNMGIAIIILTIMIRGAVFPLTNTSYRSFAKMKKIAPIVAILREKYGDDKQKMQEELIEMYQREGVNPMSGCLPIVVQIPIFFALYKSFFVTIELRHEPFFGWIQDLSAKDPTSVFNLFGLIPWDPPSVLMIGAWPCAMLLVMVVQKKLNPPPQDPLQRDMANYMPFLFAFIMSGFAAGLVVYWTFSALIGVIQQMIIMKSLGVPIHLFGETTEEEEAEAEAAAQEIIEENEAEEEAAEQALKEISPPKPKKSKKKKK